MSGGEIKKLRVREREREQFYTVDYYAAIADKKL